MIKKILAPCLLLTAILGFSSCSKDEDASTIVTVDAILKWSGDYAVDGCGFSLVIGEEKHKPTNEAEIPEVYKAAGWEGTVVEVKIVNYHKKISNGCQLPSEVNAVKILEIRKK